MRTGNGSKALLIELLIVLLFFMIAATVLLQLFSTARNMSERAELLADCRIWALRRTAACGSAMTRAGRSGYRWIRRKPKQASCAAARSPCSRERSRC